MSAQYPNGCELAPTIESSLAPLTLQFTVRGETAAFLRALSFISCQPERQLAADIVEAFAPWVRQPAELLKEALTHVEAGPEVGRIVDRLCRYRDANRLAYSDAEIDADLSLAGGEISSDERDVIVQAARIFECET
jgi:hypothetical protein